MCSSEVRSPFVPCLPQMTSFITEKVQLILTHNVREEERAQLLPLGGPWRRWMAGSGGKEAEGGRECRGWPGWSRDSEAPVLLLAMEHAHLIPINFCHHLQFSFSVTASDKTVVAGDQAGNTSHCLCDGIRWAHPARAVPWKRGSSSCCIWFPSFGPCFQLSLSQFI